MNVPVDPCGRPDVFDLDLTTTSWKRLRKWLALKCDSEDDGKDVDISFLLQHFGSLPRTMLTLYKAISGGIDWDNAVLVLSSVGGWMEYIFSAYVFFTVFCCLNIVTGIFVDNAKALKVADEEAMHHEAMKERQKWITEVAELFSKISVEKDAKLTKDDFVYHVTNSDRINTCFYHLGINTETTNTDELWELFDIDDSGCIDQDEFAIGIKQFHGVARSIDLFKLRKEVREILKQLNKIMAEGRRALVTGWSQGPHSEHLLVGSDAMSAAYLAQLGIPFGGTPVVLRPPEESLQEASKVSKSASATSQAKAAAAPTSPSGKEGPPDGRNFLEKWIEADLAPQGRCHKQKVLTRFPPEPNGYLHIGHAKSIMINFGLAHKYGGECNLRFDDTNPDTEETEYVEAIQEDVAWVCQALEMEKVKKGGKPWKNEPVYASDYFQQMYDFAIDLIKHGKAYVDSQTPEEVQKNRGGGANNLPGVDSAYRNRSVEENLKLFREMQEGKHAEGSMLLRAKIDMKHPNMNMRDPPMYRIRFSHHHRSGDQWKVYPIYDFAHGNEDAIEGVTHSICTLEFENHRALYDWFLDNCTIVPSRPYQKEFARLEVQGAVTSKRKLLRLVKEGHVTGWDDPRLLTIRGIRRRGVRPQGIKRMADGVGVSDRNSTTPFEFVEECWREDLEPISKRRLAVLDPLEVEIIDYEKEELIEGITDLPEQSASSQPSCARTLSFSKKIFIEQSDYQENPPEGYFRLGAIGSEVKLRHSYVIKLVEVVKDSSGRVVKLKCSHDSSTRDVMPADRKPKVIHWVNAKDCLDAEVRLINPLFLPMPDPVPEGKDFLSYINPEAMVRCKAKVEKALSNCVLEDRFQFERLGYFAPDYDCFTEPKKLSFNRVVPLKESADKKKIEGKGTASRKEEQQKQMAEKERLMKIPPQEFFKSERGDEFSAYDAEGVPTHDKEGNPLPKSSIKKLAKGRPCNRAPW
ncbi:unnamed protein product [Durusdinium trenchii]|uniref:glutamine--tRNA ligase n=1 Tax=Durusdinium trenchii TaxID=1381693 RepID=A0ABP0IWT4_9DINO